MKEAVIIYRLCKFDLATEEEEEVRAWRTEMGWIQNQDEVVEKKLDEGNEGMKGQGMKNY